MALNPSTAYPGRITAPDANYTYGSSKNESSPGAGDGTPYEKARADDVFGFQQALLRLSSIVPSGNAETQLVSQYVQAMVELAAGRAAAYDESGVADAYVLDPQANQFGPASYFDGLTVDFVPGNPNTGAATVDLNGIGVVDLVGSDGSALLGGELGTERVRIRYNSASGDFELDPGITDAERVNLKSGRKNAVINGNLDFWQRGVSFPGSNEYTADRFNVDSGGGTLLVTREAFTIGQTDVPNEPTYFMKLLNTVAAVGVYNLIAHRIEDVRTFAGEDVVLTFWAKMGSNKTFDIQIRQNFGSGGSGSVITKVQAVAITTSWQKFEVKVRLPSIAGKTIGAGNNLDFIFREQSFTTFQLDVAQFQLEQGKFATDFEFRPQAEELALCQRYYFKSFPQGVAPAQNVGSASGAGGDVAASGNGRFLIEIQYPVVMRTAPAVTTFNPLAANTSARNKVDNTDTPVAVNSNQSDRQATMVPNPLDATDANDELVIHITADAEL